MTSEEFEELLPAYLDGELNAEQTARVKSWLARSPQARDSLESYREINLFLESRSEQVPSSEFYSHAVFHKPFLSRARDITNTLFSFPGISSLLLVLFGIVLFIYRQPITTWIKGKTELPGSSSLGLDWVSNALQQFSGADMWTITALYVGLTVAILLSTSLMVMRFLRD
jgi:predicted anti-sigma-YlaC factor YlaD